MSKRILRISISLLIFLILLAGVYTVVYGAAPFGKTSPGRMAYIPGSYRDFAPVLNLYNYGDSSTHGHGLGCDGSDAGLYNPADD